MQKERSFRGFTLIELLVTVAIIGVLASLVLPNLNAARGKGRDARRISDLKQIQAALEMYYNDFGSYPPRNSSSTETDTGGCGGTTGWCDLQTDLAPYLSKLSGDPLGVGATTAYYYDADSGDNYQSYGFMLRFESSSYNAKESGDGGYLGYGTLYEVGAQPAYCVSKYTGADSNWWGGTTNVCIGGN